MRLPEDVFARLREQILAEVDLSREMGVEEVTHLIAEHVDDYAHEHMMTLREREALEQSLFHSLRKLDVLQELLEDAEITEIMVNGADKIFYEKGGRLYESEKRFSSKEKLDDVIQQIAGYSNRMYGVHFKGGGSIFTESCHRRVQHFYLRWYRFREDDVSKRAFAVYSTGRAYHYN